MGLAPTDRLSCPPEVLSRVLDGEAVLLQLDTGMYFGMNEVASKVWERIVKGATVREIVEGITAEFEVDEATIEKDLGEFVRALVEKRLCSISPTAG
jgi:hypothetical protein